MASRRKRKPNLIEQAQSAPVRPEDRTTFAECLRQLADLVESEGIDVGLVTWWRKGEDSPVLATAIERPKTPADKGERAQQIVSSLNAVRSHADNYLSDFSFPKGSS